MGRRWFWCTGRRVVRTSGAGSLRRSRIGSGCTSTTCWESERREGQDVSIVAQGRALKEPAVAGHDIGGGIVLRAHLLEGTRFRRISLLDAVVSTPWGTPALRHVKEHLGAYRTMPDDVFEAYVAARLRETTARPMDEAAFEAYLSQWRGAGGKG